MPKRRCPFSDCRPQMKVHVSDKEVANGIFKTELMKTVYDRTMNLLYQGAKNAENLTPSAEFPSDKNHNLKLKGNDAYQFSLKQMTLNHKCQLQLSTFSQEDQSTAPIICSGCGGMQHLDMMSCASCDSAACSNCIVICNKCHELFCCSCTFNVYDGGENHICRNCL